MSRKPKLKETEQEQLERQKALDELEQATARCEEEEKKRTRLEDLEDYEEYYEQNKTLLDELLPMAREFNSRNRQIIERQENIQVASELLLKKVNAQTDIVGAFNVLSTHNNTSQKLLAELKSGIVTKEMSDLKILLQKETTRAESAEREIGRVAASLQNETTRANTAKREILRVTKEMSDLVQKETTPGTPEARNLNRKHGCREFRTEFLELSAVNSRSFLEVPLPQEN